MLNYKQLLSGILIGGLLTMGGTALADNSGIPAITNWVKFKINGVEKELSDSYTVLNYEDHTYVPIRYIAEELGAEVDWDETTNTIIINNEKIEQPISSDGNKTESTEKSSTEKDDTPTIYYEQLPVSKTLNGVSVELYSIDQTDYQYTKLYFRVKNSNDVPIQFIQATGYLKAEGKVYDHTSVKSNTIGWKDTTWYVDLNEDEDNEGYIMIEKVPNEIVQGTVHVEVLQNDRTQKITNFEFNIKWE